MLYCLYEVKTAPKAPSLPAGTPRPVSATSCDQPSWRRAMMSKHGTKGKHSFRNGQKPFRLKTPFKVAVKQRAPHTSYRPCCLARDNGGFHFLRNACQKYMLVAY